MKRRHRTTEYEGQKWSLDRNEDRLRLMRDDTVVWWGAGPIPIDLAPLEVLLELSLDPT